MQIGATPSRGLALIARRMRLLTDIRRIVLVRYESTDRRSDSVRAAEIQEFVAEELGRSVNAKLARDLAVVAQQLGWRHVRPHNVSTYRYVRRRDAAAG